MYASAPINEFYQPVLTVMEGKALLEFVVREKFYHAAGAMHGSVYFKAMDDAAYFAVNTLVKDVFVLTASFNIYLTRPVTKGQVKTVGKVVSASSRMFVAEAVMYDEQGREVGRGSGSFMKSAAKLAPEIGYL